MMSLVRLSIRPQSDHKTDSQSLFQSLVVPVFKTMHGSYQNIKKKKKKKLRHGNQAFTQASGCLVALKCRSTRTL